MYALLEHPSRSLMFASFCCHQQQLPFVMEYILIIFSKAPNQERKQQLCPYINGQVHSQEYIHPNFHWRTLDLSLHKHLLAFIFYICLYSSLRCFLKQYRIYTKRCLALVLLQRLRDTKLCFCLQHFLLSLLTILYLTLFIIKGEKISHGSCTHIVIKKNWKVCLFAVYLMS